MLNNGVRNQKFDIFLALLDLVLFKYSLCQFSLKL